MNLMGMRDLKHCPSSLSSAALADELYHRSHNCCVFPGLPPALGSWHTFRLACNESFWWRPIRTTCREKHQHLVSLRKSLGGCWTEPEVVGGGSISAPEQTSVLARVGIAG